VALDNARRNSDARYTRRQWVDHDRTCPDDRLLTDIGKEDGSATHKRERSNLERT
jgi:hypothetical protein